MSMELSGKGVLHVWSADCPDVQAYDVLCMHMLYMLTFLAECGWLPVQQC